MEDKIIKHSIVDLNTSLLPDYLDFQNVNDDWDVEKHLNFNYDISAAIAFSKLYFPTFIEYEGCIILESRFDKSIFEEWKNKFKGNISEVEKMCNLYETKDFFHINDSDSSLEKSEQLGVLLKKSWEVNLKSLFPDRNMTIVLFEQDGNNYITLHSK